MAGGPGVSAAVARGRAGKFKTKRGGGRHFTRGLRPVDSDGVEKGMWASDQENSDEEEGSGSGSEESSSEDELTPADLAIKPVVIPAESSGGKTREQRKAEQKAKKAAAIAKKKGPVQPGDLPSSDEDEQPYVAPTKSRAQEPAGEDSDDSLANDPMLANPNHTAAARNQAALAAPATAEEAEVATNKSAAAKSKAAGDGNYSNLSRREREAIQAQEAKLRYEKMRAEGKTEEARADMERLKLVRAQRAEAAERKAAEDEEKAMLKKEKEEQMARMERAQAAADNKKKLNKKGKK